MTTPTPEAQAQRKQLNLNLDLDYFKTPAGQLRVAQGVLSLAALVSSVEGQCKNDIARHGFFLCVVIITLLEAISIIILFVLKQDKKIKTISLPLTLFMNDSIVLLFYFINCTLSMLSIGRCHYRIEARVITTLFAVALFLVHIGLAYTDYKLWEKDNSSKETATNGSTNVTESSPTVLT